MDIAVLKKVLGLKDEATEADIIAAITTARVTQLLRVEPRRVIPLGDELTSVTGLHRSQIKELEAAGKFPKGYRLSANKKVWFADDVKRWQDQRVAVAERNPEVTPAPQSQPRRQPADRADRDDDQSDRGAERAEREHAIRRYHST
jgi:predicted DNA-binding transcriptional regulator AlpA